MSNIEILKELNDRGLLKSLVMSGVIAPTVVRNMEIYYSVDAKIKTGKRKESAINEVQCEMGVCRATVYNVVKSFK